MRTAYGAWKDTHPDQAPRAAQFEAAFRSEHGHGPSIEQLCEGLGWAVVTGDPRAFIIHRLIANEWLTSTSPVPRTLRPGKAAQQTTAA